MNADSGTDGGTEGNARLTAANGVVLTVLLLIEGVTILDVRGYITLHTAIGLVLIGPVLLKCASTCYRFARYYSGAPAYVRRGAPPILLRAVGPLVVVSSLAVIATGVVLLSDHGASDTWLTLHKASFVVWVIVMAVHFLGHLRDATVETAREFRRGSDPATRHRAIRLLAIAGALVVGIGLAAGLTPSASSWNLHHDDHGRHAAH